jgi:hypothetical protein
MSVLSDCIDKQCRNQDISDFVYQGYGLKQNYIV